MSQLPQGRYQFDARTWQELQTQMNVFAERLQVGGLVLAGLKLALRDVAPTTAPAAGTANVVVATVGGIVRLYIWDGAAWQVAGTQT